MGGETGWGDRWAGSKSYYPGINTLGAAPCDTADTEELRTLVAAELLSSLLDDVVLDQRSHHGCSQSADNRTYWASPKLLAVLGLRLGIH